MCLTHRHSGTGTTSVRLPQTGSPAPALGAPGPALPSGKELQGALPPRVGVGRVDAPESPAAGTSSPASAGATPDRRIVESIEDIAQRLAREERKYPQQGDNRKAFQARALRELYTALHGTKVDEARLEGSKKTGLIDEMRADLAKRLDKNLLPRFLR